MKQYINTENVNRRLAEIIPDGEGKVLLSDVRAAIAAAPSEDVVEAVRCKHCRHWRFIDIDTAYCNQDRIGNCPPDGWCHNGERGKR